MQKLKLTCAILAKVLASNGAITIMSASLPSSTCNTGSPLCCQACHSKSSSYTFTSVGSSDILKKCLACSVTTR